jgi:hypothetical protein
MEFAASNGAAMIARDILTHPSREPYDSVECVAESQRKWQNIGGIGNYSSTAKPPARWIEELYGQITYPYRNGLGDAIDRGMV